MRSPSSRPSAEARPFSSASGLGANTAPRAGAEVLLTEEPLACGDLAALVRSPALGAVVTMEGTVRGSEEGRPLAAIEYEAYAPMAEKIIRRAREEAERRWPVRAAARHRVGVVRAGEAAVVVAAAGVHRPEAFEACRFLIDRIKEQAPIWKARFRWKAP